MNVTDREAGESGAVRADKDWPPVPDGGGGEPDDKVCYLCQLQDGRCISASAWLNGRRSKMNPFQFTEVLVWCDGSSTARASSTNRYIPRYCNASKATNVGVTSTGVNSTAAKIRAPLRVLAITIP